MRGLVVTTFFLISSLPIFSQFDFRIGSSVISTDNFFIVTDVFGDSIELSRKERFVGLSFGFSKHSAKFGTNNSNEIGIEVNTNFWIYHWTKVWFNPNIGVYFSKSFGKSNLYSPLNFGLMSIKYRSTGTEWDWVGTYIRENKMNLTGGLGYSYGDLLKFYAEVLYSPVFNTDKLNPLRIQVGLKWKILKKYN